MLTPQLPYPPHQGTSLRNYHLLCGLTERHQVTLLSFVEPGQVVEPTLRDLCAAIHEIPAPTHTIGKRLWYLGSSRMPDMAHRLQSNAFGMKLEDLIRSGEFDLVQIEGLELASYIPLIKEASAGKCRIVFDNHNAETQLQTKVLATDWQIPSRWPAAFYSLMQIPRLRRFETAVCRKADWVTVVSDTDRKILEDMALGVPVTTVPNCIDVEQYQTVPKEKLRCFDLVFSGKMDYRPNVDAMLWFAQQVWPIIRKARPQTSWAIVGQKPNAKVKALAELPNVTVTGWVTSVQPYLSGGTLFIMPLRMGSGTRLKLIEAMASSLPIVSTRIGAEGFPLTDGQQLLLVDEPDAFAQAVLTLLDDEARRTRIAAEALQFAAQYDWRQIVPRFEEVYHALGVN